MVLVLFWTAYSPATKGDKIPYISDINQTVSISKLVQQGNKAVYYSSITNSSINRLVLVNNMNNLILLFVYPSSEIVSPGLSV